MPYRCNVKTNVLSKQQHKYLGAECFEYSHARPRRCSSHSAAVVKSLSDAAVPYGKSHCIFNWEHIFDLITWRELHFPHILQTDFSGFL